MSKKVAILQSNYLPWKGYFDLINQVDEFIIYDEAAYTKNDWRNRNRIKGPNGPFWITIPIKGSGRRTQKISEAEALNLYWVDKHWKSIIQCYIKAPYFTLYQDYFKELYSSVQTTNLSQINLTFIKGINKLLNIKTALSSSTDYSFEGDKTEKLVSICQKAGATTYISGPAAKNYLNTSLFERNNIKVEWMSYHYSEYPQLFPPFISEVSILDLLFNVGPEAMSYIKSTSTSLPLQKNGI